MKNKLIAKQTSYDITVTGSVSESKKYFELIRYWTELNCSKK